MRTVAPHWSFEVLLALFEAAPGDVLETELLRRFFPDEDLFTEGVGLELFEKHFLLYRRLWLFDDELRRQGRRLWLRGIRASLVGPATGCDELEAETGRLCDRPLPCDRHAGQPALPSMRDYYLDWRNLETMTSERLSQLVDGFWRYLGDADSVAAALAAFGLDDSATPEAIVRRWRELSKKNHPDRGGDSAVFQDLSAAWHVLKKRYFLAANASPTVL